MEKKRIRDILPHNNDGSIAWDHADCLKHMQEGFDRQGQWFVEEMMPLLEAHRTTVYIMPGNSDWKHHFQPGGLWTNFLRLAELTVTMNATNFLKTRLK